jgi:predicted nucleic acid-binding protein
MTEDNRRYWDTNCFLRWLNNEPDGFDDCKNVLKAAEEGHIVIYTSAWALVEVLHVKSQKPLLIEQKKEVEGFFERYLHNDYIKLISVTRPISEIARACFWEHYGKIKPADCVHVASAKELNIPLFNTFDEGLIKLDKKIGNPPMEIKRPKYSTQGILQIVKEVEKE